MSPYQPPGYSQVDGSKFGRQNCVFAVCTDLIDRATVGALRIQAPVLRKVSGDTSGGVTYSQASQAVWKATKQRVYLRPRYDLRRTQVRDLSEAGIAFGISIHTSVTKDTRFRTNSYIGGHTVYVQDYDESDNTYLVEDPGTTYAGYMWWPADLLYRAAERRGGGKINVLVAPDTEDVSRVGSMAGRIRKTPMVTAPAIGHVQLGKAYFVTSTTNGGMWIRADGGQSNGWHRLGAQGYVAGERLSA